MGLDIYLYRYDRPVAEVEAADEKWEACTSEIFSKYYDESTHKFDESRRSEYEKDTKAAAKKHGRIGKWNNNSATEKIEISHPKHRKHYFKIGYFRSSYNASGINRILEDRIGQTLYSILGVNCDEYVQRPDWNSVIVRCESAIEQLEAFDLACPFSVMECDHSFLSGSPDIDSAKALKIAQEQLMARKKSAFGDSAYSNANGTFIPKGIKIFGAINGKNCLGVPAVYLVTKSDGHKWYISALEIVRDTAKWVLKQKDPQKYYLHVSG